MVNAIERTASPRFVPPAIGDVIAVNGRRFQIGEAIGAGSFSAAYECVDEWQNPLVAKVLFPRERPYDEIKLNWLKELQKLVHLRHPNITYVHEAFEYRNAFYLIIERCSFTLERLIDSGDLTPDIWIPHLARDVLHALDFIHQRGYVHKDIHPGNVFVHLARDRMIPSREPVWSFKVGDLGISNVVTEIDVFNTTLAPWILPPEAIAPTQFGTVGIGTDIYHAALLLLAFLLQAKPQFTREEIVAGLPRRMAEQSSSPFGAALARALRRHVRDRTPTAMDFWRDIQMAASQSAMAHPTCLPGTTPADGPNLAPSAT